ncbi:mannose-1-phosphate guanylyltransferase [Arcanobacterium buesumense]|uniref:Mannose-1-phosphate guanylyltransferase n=1 Tax=Arcanobacterium buesumense TaxID=2722751 RepID=A0A6H2EMA3_9ACTO|nr:mannose-1-phosphate guanylyltransferase [Arcanobacterium buesumense]QJC22203.1 mannose-1-phosphate guanylyltransferase [Arcanobacterium buesumense]
MSSLHAIIPAGGAGTRLWPISRSGSPKFLKDLTGSGQSLLRQTVERLSPVAGSNIMVVTGGIHIPHVVRQLPELDAEQFIAEPSARDSMAAIGLATAIIRQRHGNVIVGSFAADHIISQPQAFVRAVNQAMTAAERGYVVTIGISPDSPATGFGYIRAADEVDGVAGVFQAAEFLEKPDADTARRYVDSGQYLWNAGMFIAQADVLLTALESFQPSLAEGISRIARAWDTTERSSVLEHEWPELTKIAIDHAIAEPLASRGGVAVVPVQMGWTDVGDFAAVDDMIRESLDDNERHGLVVRSSDGGQAPPVIAVDSHDVTVFTYDRPIAVVGVNDVIVVDTGDVLLVTASEDAQHVKNVVEQLPEHNLTSLQ